MKKIGIIFAMKKELDALLGKIELINKYKIYDLIFYECKFKNTKCILVESGIGKVNSARCTQILIDTQKVDYIFNIGIAGSVSSDVNICDIVIANNLVQHDFDLTPFNHEKGYIPNIGTYIQTDDNLLKLAKQINIESNIHIGTIASGDIFISDKNISKKISSKFNALCVEMEGASIAQVCYLSKVPFLVIRSISDSPNKNNNKLTYEEFSNISAETVAKFMKQVLEKLS